MAACVLGFTLPERQRGMSNHSLYIEYNNDLGCHRENTLDWVAQMAEIYFLAVVEAGSPRSGATAYGQILVKLFLACRQLPSYPVYMAFL